MNRATLSQVLCITLLLFLTSYKLNAQGTVNTREQLQKLITKGNNLADKGDNAKGIEYLTRAEMIAEKNDWKKELVDIKNSIGISYLRLSNLGEAMGYFNQAYDIAKKKQGLEEYYISITNNIGNIYQKEDDFISALKYYKEAYKIANERKIDRLIVASAINLSDIYNLQGRYNDAEKYLQETNNIKKTEELEFFWRLNYAETLYLKGNVNRAIEDLQKLLVEVDPNKYKECYVFIVERLSKIYTKQNNLPLAMAYAKKGLKSLPELKYRIELYQQLANIYFKNQDYNNYKKYNDSVLIAKDSLGATINRGLFESNKVKLKVQEYQSELKSKTEKQETQRNLFIVVILLVLVVSFALYRGMRNKLTRQAQEKIIADKQQQIISLELEGLKNNIAEKNRKLSAKALYLSGRNELIEEVVNSISGIPQISRNKEISDYLKKLKTYLRTDAEWDDFTTFFEQANPDFLKKLTAKHPQLTSADIRFICYVLMNLDIREISTIFNITINAATKRKRRIKEKMEIDKDDSLYEYLLKLT
jgi:tetratricopeptide (TPR) repeat protein